MNDTHFQAYMNACPDAVFVCDHDGVILKANPAAERMYGVLEAKPLENALWPGSLGLFQKAWKLAAGGQTMHEQSLETRLADGTRLVTNASFVPVAEASQEIICILKDAQEFRKFFSQMVQAEKMASLGRLAGGIAHQLNTPLGSILLTTQLLSDSLTEPEQLADVEKIIRQVKVCKEIINHFLRISRPGETDPQEELSLAEQVNEVVALFDKPLREKDLQVALLLGCGDCRIRGNRTLLNQLFINLLSNAIDVMPQGGRLELSTACAPGSVRILIRDQGPGIPEADRANIFDPFFTTKPVGEGTGLGLYIAHRVAQEHGGNLELAETGETGSTFVLTLPQACALEPASRRI